MLDEPAKPSAPRVEARAGEPSARDGAGRLDADLRVPLDSQRACRGACLRSGLVFAAALRSGPAGREAQFPGSSSVPAAPSVAASGPSEFTRILDASRMREDGHARRTWRGESASGAATGSPAASRACNAELTRCPPRRQWAECRGWGNASAGCLPSSAAPTARISHELRSARRGHARGGRQPAAGAGNVRSGPAALARRSATPAAQAA